MPAIENCAAVFVSDVVRILRRGTDRRRLIVSQVLRPGIREVQLGSAREAMLKICLQAMVIRVIPRFEHVDRSITAEGTDLIEDGRSCSERSARDHACRCDYTRILQRRCAGCAL